MPVLCRRGQGRNVRRVPSFRPTLASGSPERRELTIHWTDPAAAADAARGLSGLAVLQRMVAGKIAPPPAAQLIGITIVAVEDGYIEMTLEPAEFMYNTIGSVHGGIVTTLLDSAMGCAVTTKLDATTAHATIDLHVNFVRPATVATGQLRATGRVLHRGARTATAEGRVLDTRQALYAHATTTCLLMPRATGDA